MVQHHLSYLPIQLLPVEIDNLREGILTLPEKQRAVFNMKYFDDMKYEDMSEIFGTSVGALKASYHHAVKKVEEFLTKDI